MEVNVQSFSTFIKIKHYWITVCFAGNQSSVWKEARVTLDLSNGTVFSFSLVSIIGPSYLGDIAADDVMLETGSCQSSTNSNVLKQNLLTII